MISPTVVTYEREQLYPQSAPTAATTRTEPTAPAPSRYPRVFSDAAYRRLLAPLKVRVETCEAETGVIRSSEAWAAGVDGTIYLRPIHGARSGWYRDLLATPSVGTPSVGTPSVSVRLDGARIPVAARPVTEPGRLRDVDAALLRRYGYHPMMPLLLDASSVEATIELEPA